MKDDEPTILEYRALNQDLARRKRMNRGILIGLSLGFPLGVGAGIALDLAGFQRYIGYDNTIFVILFVPPACGAIGGLIARWT